MKEDFLQFIWKFQLFHQNNLQTTNNLDVEVLNIGFQNTDAGPDFSNAKIKIGETIWAGNVEIELKASNWYKHKHHENSAFDNVILVACLEADKPIRNTQGAEIPVLKIIPDKHLLNEYDNLMNNQHWAICHNHLAKIDNFRIKNWLEQLLIERLEQKTDAINTLYKQTNNNWEEAFYRQLAQNFGLKINVEPFGRLAVQLPQVILSKQKNSLMQIEALLFGQAGFLEGNFTDEYPNMLKKEYQFLAKKYQLSPIHQTEWKFLRLRPIAFPTIRIALFAQLIFQSQHLFSKIIEKPEIAEISNLLNVSVSEYWQTHYKFDKESARKTKKTGAQFIQNIMINTIVPFLFVYSRKKGLEDLNEKSLDLLDKLPAEKNSIITDWAEIGLKAKTAFESQALLQLRKKYCTPKKCVNCVIGTHLFSHIILN